MKLKNRIVVVTGAGSGIGSAYAIESEKEEAQVIKADINLERAEESVRQIVADNGKAAVLKTDSFKFEFI